MTDVQTLPAVAEAAAAANGVVAQLQALLGKANVSTDMKERVFYSTDIFVQGVTAEAIIRPTSSETLAKAVALCTGAGWAVIARGGGFSYTQGYIPTQANTIMVDMQSMNRIVEINEEDLYVTVETGCTWTQLYDALKEKKLRTPYFGPMSGYRSTVGGALSQGSFFLGSTEYGTTADTVLGLEVVLADGTVLTTGSAASIHSSSPFFRNYGPDITGLFLHDSGSLGLKTRAMLKLMPMPEHGRFATFPFDEAKGAVAAMSEIGRKGLAAECYCWDPALAKNFGSRNSVADDLKYLKGVVKSGSSLLSGLKDAARMALSGKSVFDGKTFLLHVTIDDVSEAGAEERLKLVQAIVQKNGGAEVEGSAPRALRGTPFVDFVPFAQDQLPNRNLPVHGLFPHSKIQKITADTYAFFDANKALMDAHGITLGVIFFDVGSTAVCIETLFYWDDPQMAAHNRATSLSDLDVLAKHPERPAAGAAVADLRKQLVDMYTVEGSAHVQIGKSYRYQQSRRPELYGLLTSIKDVVDPKGLINPGALGLQAKS